MSRVQTRRTISFNRSVYNAIMQASADRGVSCAEFVTEALRTAGLEIPETSHAHIEEVRRAIAGRARMRTRKATPAVSS